MAKGQSIIGSLDDLCAEHGCPPGVNRFTWLDYMLGKLAKLEAERDALRAAVKEARKAALEEALIACNGEALEDPTGSADDIAYDLAVEDCRNAIRAIAAKEPNRE